MPEPGIGGGGLGEDRLGTVRSRISRHLERHRPKYENLSKDVLFFPELEAERLFLTPKSAESKGIEIYVKRDVGKKLSFWTSYAMAWAEERIDGSEVAKNADQRHTLYLNANFRPNRQWRINVAWQYRSGWPYSEQFFVRRNARHKVFLRSHVAMASSTHNVFRPTTGWIFV